VLAPFVVEGGDSSKTYRPGLDEFRTGDVNGDGYTDLIIVTKVATGSGEDQHPYWYRYWFCEGPAITSTNNCVLFHSVIAIGENTQSGVLASKIADFDGDGRADILVLMADYSSLGYCAGTVAGPGSCGAIGIANLPNAPLSAEIGDFDGDGKSDVYVIASIGAWFCKGAGPATLSSCVQNHAGDWSGFRIYGGDYNGDGLADLYLIGPTSTYFCPGGYRLTLAGTGGSNCQLMHGYDWSVFAVYPGDYNGDGKTDLFLVSQWNMYFCTGLDNALDCPLLSNENWSQFAMIPGDYQGRGMTDIYKAGSLVTLASVWGPDLLARITTGLGATVDLAYKPITADGALGGVYFKEPIPPAHASPSPLNGNTIEMRPPIYVVHNETHSNGIGGSNTNLHYYSGALFNADGRGFLGFQWHQSNGQSTRIVQRTRFRQDYPFVGMPYELHTIAYDPFWTIGWSVSYTYNHYRAKQYLVNSPSPTDCGLDLTQCAPDPGRRYFLYLYIGDDVKHEFSGPTQSTPLFIARTVNSIFDEFGNLVQSQNHQYDMNWSYLNYDKVTYNIYSNNEPSWILGRLLKSTVTSNCPGTSPTLCQ
jgi:hypothetical protein